MDNEKYLEGQIRIELVDKHLQIIKKELDETLCRECPLQNPCRLTLAIQRKDICSILRENQKTEEKPNGRD